ncbi:MAG: hypothetical protein ABSF81_03840 [Bacteroidales bacterium]|jgi:hypothetical protein
MSPKYKEPGKPRGRDYLIGSIVIIVLTISGMVIFGLDWGIGGADADVVWICFDLIMFMNLGRIIRKIYRLQFKKLQIDRDEVAGRLATGKHEDFFLYLRPFNSTGRLPITVRVNKVYTKFPGSSPKTYGEIEDLDLEQELTRALEPCAPLVALGKPGEHIGAGLIKTDDQSWQSLFLDLSSRATAIFIVPGTTEGTRWELDSLAKDEALRKKTILIIPPQMLNENGTPFQDSGGLRFNFKRPLTKLNIFGPRHDTSPRLEAIEALTSHGIDLQDRDTSQGLLIHYSSTSNSVPIISYTKPVNQRGLLGWWLNSGYSYENGKVMKLGLRNAIFSIEPRLANLQKSS